MASAVPPLMLEPLRTRPLNGPALWAVVAAVWIAGALYCSGYEKLSSGIDNWPGSLIWSAVAVLPWLALAEWSKSVRGRVWTNTGAKLLLALVLTAAASLTLEIGWKTEAGGQLVQLPLLLLRRLPAIAACLLVILWSRAGRQAETSGEELPMDLAAIAPSIDWVESADNYVELHVGGRIVTRRLRMQDAERALRSLGFVRIHRRYLVNRKRIAALHGSGSNRVVRLRCGTALPIGGAFAPNLKAG